MKLEGMSTAKIVLFHQGSTELRRCENCVFFLPVNILTGVTCRLLGPHDTLPCVLICNIEAISVAEDLIENTGIGMLSGPAALLRSNFSNINSIP